MDENLKINKASRYSRNIRKSNHQEVEIIGQQQRIGTTKYGVIKTQGQNWETNIEKICLTLGLQATVIETSVRG